MTESDEIELLGEIAAQGGSRYTSGNVDRTKYERLVEAGWLKRFCPNISDVVYEVTDAGKAALGKLGT